MTRVALPVLGGVPQALFRLLREPLLGAGGWLVQMAASGVNVGVAGLVKAGKSSLIMVRDAQSDAVVGALVKCDRRRLPATRRPIARSR